MKTTTHHFMRYFTVAIVILFMQSCGNSTTSKSSIKKTSVPSANLPYKIPKQPSPLKIKFEEVENPKTNRVDVFIASPHDFATTLKIENFRVDTNVSILPEAMDISLRRSFPQSFTIPKKMKRTKLFSIKGTRQQYRYDYMIYPYAMTDSYDGDHIYELPYAKGSSIEIMQGHNSFYTHYGDTAFAIVF